MIQYWEVSTFSQVVHTIGSDTINKSINQLVASDSTYQKYTCPSDSKMYLISTTRTTTEEIANFTIDGNYGGVIIVGTHPTCS